jgi:FG-GAP-like repeat
MELCVNCWVKNVEVGYWYGGGIDIVYSARSELNNVYVHHAANSVNNGGEYPIALDNASTEILITNSISNFGGKGMVARAGGAGSVVSYSYIDDTMYDALSGIGDYWVETALAASHYSGPHHVLFEGNWTENMDSDLTHGNSMYMTYFRNQGTGLRTPFTDPSNGDAVNDATGLGFAAGQTYPWPPGPLRAAGPMAYNYWFAFVGNVLGQAGKTTAANGWSYQGDFTQHRIFMLGWNAGPGGEDPYLDGVTASYVFRHGDYDYYNNSIVDWASGYSHTLPNSFYLSSAPSFFAAGASCTYPWPWVTPTGPTQIQTNSCGGSGLPAKARWDAGTPLCVECSRGANHDFNGDGMSDILWRDNSGDVAWWLVDGATILSSGGVGSIPAAWSIVGQRDFNGDGTADFLWRDDLGNTSIWFMNGTTVASAATVGNIPINWSVVGVGDFNGDGIGDFLWRDSSGDLAVWLMNKATVMSSAGLGNVPTNWTVVGVGDFNGNGMSDILWQDSLGNTSVWFMNGTTVASAETVGNIPINWSAVGVGDFNGDGKSDIVWRDAIGDTSIWLMNGAAVLSAGVLGNISTAWSIALVGDYNGDGMSDLLWRDSLGNTAVWFMNGTAVASTGGMGNIPTNWTVQSVNAE